MSEFDFSATQEANMPEEASECDFDGKCESKASGQSKSANSETSAAQVECAKRVSLLQLRVGDRTFMTSERTLNRSPKLRRLLERNCLEVDRNGDVFEYVLDFLRGYSLDFQCEPLSTRAMRSKLADDARFYRLTKLSERVAEAEQSEEAPCKAPCEAQKESEDAMLAQMLAVFRKLASFSAQSRGPSAVESAAQGAEPSAVESAAPCAEHSSTYDYPLGMEAFVPAPQWAETKPEPSEKLAKASSSAKTASGTAEAPAPRVGRKRARFPRKQAEPQPALRTRQGQGESIRIRLQEDGRERPRRERPLDGRERPVASSDSEDMEEPLPLPRWQNVGFEAGATPSFQVLQSLLGGVEPMMFPFAPRYQ